MNQLPTPEEKGLVRDALELGSMRKALRNRSADTRSMMKKNRRTTALQERLKADSEETLLTWARVYIEGRGNEHVRRNVTKAVHAQARRYAEQSGETFEVALKRAEGAMLNALAKDAA